MIPKPGGAKRKLGQTTPACRNCVDYGRLLHWSACRESEISIRCNSYRFRRAPAAQVDDLRVAPILPALFEFLCCGRASVPAIYSLACSECSSAGSAGRGRPGSRRCLRPRQRAATTAMQSRQTCRTHPPRRRRTLPPVRTAMLRPVRRRRPGNPATLGPRKGLWHWLREGGFGAPHW